MAEENDEICGFLDVKFCWSKSRVHKVKKRTLGPWKVWKRHWCSFKTLGTEQGVIVNLDFCFGNCSIQQIADKEDRIIIPQDVVICRTQSRSKQFAFGIFPTKERKPLLLLAGNSEIESQRWMANIRQLLRPRNLKVMAGFHSISLIDNAHSKASGLTGLYGDLKADTLGVVIKDFHSGEVVENFEWKELHQFHLATAGQPEDVKCICVVHTTKEFRAGIGELHIFCTEASKLLQDLVTQGRGFRHKAIRRPLSLSEGDIRAIDHDELSRSFSTVNERIKFRAKGRRETSERYEEIKNSKMPNKMTEDLYQPEPYSSSFTRRCSNISTASGIYEEIPDETDGGSSWYMNNLFLHREEPPPLPPRQRCASESMKGCRSQDSRIISGPSSLPLISHRNSIQIEKNNFESRKITDESNYVPMSPHRNSIQIEKNNFESRKITDESSYVPMSPRLKDIMLYNLDVQTALPENDYVVMR